MMLEKLAELEEQARQLDPGREQREDLLRQAGDYSEQLLAQIEQAKAYVPDDGNDGFLDAPPAESPLAMPELLKFYRREVDTTGILPASGGQLGYIPGGGLYPSALGEYLAAISNRYSGVAFAGPGASRMEHSLVQWMCRLVAYPDTAAGDLTSGGSIATLSALVAARDACKLVSTAFASACVYVTGQAHHCISKALHVAGMGETQRRIVPMDSRFRMDTAALENMIAKDRERGLQPWLVVASAGTTDTGAVDPIETIASIAKHNSMWFHLDAAYGGFFLLCKEGRKVLSGTDRADSIVMDPHKGLGIPYGTGAVLLRQGHLLAESNAYYADYMQDAKDAVPGQDSEFSPADYSLELTRHFRGPRMWFPLKLFGLRPFRAALAEKIWLARYFYEELSQLDGFETGPYPDLSIVTFRYRPVSGDRNTFNRQLLDAIHKDGQVFITSTMIDGHFTLRLAVLNFRTHRNTIDYLLKLLRKETGRLAKALS